MRDDALAEAAEVHDDALAEAAEHDALEVEGAACPSSAYIPHLLARG